MALVIGAAGLLAALLVLGLAMATGRTTYDTLGVPDPGGLVELGMPVVRLVCADACRAQAGTRRGAQRVHRSRW